MKSLVTRFIKDESGATAIEYGLIVGVMAVLIIGALNTFGTGLTATFTNIGARLSSQATQIPTN